jgi:hypothetical protein
MARLSSRIPKIVFTLSLTACGLNAQTTPSATAETPSVAPQATDAQTPSDTESNAVKEIHPGIFTLGDVVFDKRHRTVTFPARLNLTQGPMEYFLVTTWGKVHESILQTETDPFRIHTAMLLLGAKGAGTNSAAENSRGSAFIVHPSKARIPGDKISVEVKWSVNGKKTQRRAEELIFNRASKSNPQRGNWVYNGSRVWEDIFIAQADGSVVSLVTDSCALINNTAPGHDNDTIWMANTNKLPPADVPVEVTIKLKD